ncbi:MAG: hypothetical protein AAFU67_05215, partial [Bacteroidota bacterium]
RPTNKQSRADLAGHLARRIELHQRLHQYLLTHEANYYAKQGDYLRGTLLHHYRYWAAFNRRAAVSSAQTFFPKIGGLPRHTHGLLPGWLWWCYRYLGFATTEFFRSLVSS